MIINDNYVHSFDTCNVCTKTGFDFIYLIVYLFWVWFKIPAIKIPKNQNLDDKIPTDQNPDKMKIPIK